LRRPKVCNEKLNLKSIDIVECCCILLDTFINNLFSVSLKHSFLSGLEGITKAITEIRMRIRAENNKSPRWMAWMAGGAGGSRPGQSQR